MTNEPAMVFLVHVNIAAAVVLMVMSIWLHIKITRIYKSYIGGVLAMRKSFKPDCLRSARVSISATFFFLLAAAVWVAKNGMNRVPCDYWNMVVSIMMLIYQINIIHDRWLNFRVVNQGLKRRKW